MILRKVTKKPKMGIRRKGAKSFKNPLPYTDEIYNAIARDI